MHRILFRIPLPFGFPPLDIASYGVMMAVAILVGTYIAVVRGRKLGESSDNVLDLALCIVIAGLVGSRLMYLFVDGWAEIKPHSVWGFIKTFFQFRRGGLSFFGAILLGLPTGIVFLRLRRLNVWRFADITAPSIALGIGFARIGCFLNGCCFGTPCPEGFPFPVEFPADSVAADEHLALTPLYPTQLISAANGVLLFVLLSILFRYRKFDGHIFWTFVPLYALTRFFIEFLRGDNKPVIAGLFTLWQGLTLGLLALSVVMLLVLRKRPLSPVPS